MRILLKITVLTLALIHLPVFASQKRWVWSGLVIQKLECSKNQIQVNTGHSTYLMYATPELCLVLQRSINQDCQETEGEFDIVSTETWHGTAYDTLVGAKNLAPTPYCYGRITGNYSY